MKLFQNGHLRLVPDGTRIHFMRGRFAGLIVSAILSTISVVLFFHPGLHYGIDFQGGIVMEVRTPAAADFPQLRGVLAAQDVGVASLQQFGSPNDVLVRLPTQPGGEAAQQKAIDRVREALTREVAGAQIRRVEQVGPSVSGELFRGGMMALGLSMLAMLAYIWFRFEWQFGVGAIVTLILDVTKTIGFYVIADFQFNLSSVAAILTIMGFSINDKVVVYDRVRENLRKYKSMPLRQLIDQGRAASALATLVARGHVGRLRLGISEIYAWHPDVLRTLQMYRRESPGVTFLIEAMLSGAVTNRVLDGHLDLALATTGPLPADGPLVSAPWLVDEYRLAVNTASPLYRRPPRRLADLNGEDFVLFRRDQSAYLHDLMIHHFHQRGFSPHVVQEGTTHYTVLGLIAAGLGSYAAYIPFNAMLFERMIASFRIVGNAGFLIYLADSFGYLSSTGVLIIKNFAHPQLSWLAFLQWFGYILAAVALGSIVFALLFFERKHRRTP